MGFVDNLKFVGSEGDMSKDSRFVSVFSRVSYLLLHNKSPQIWQLKITNISVSLGQESGNHLSGLALIQSLPRDCSQDESRGYSHLKAGPGPHCPHAESWTGAPLSSCWQLDPPKQVI